jgi:prepilin-type processing-associated H-X9-DG protein
VNNLKQLGLALNNYESAAGAFPPQQTMLQLGNQQPYSYTSWGVSARLAPYLEQGPMYNSMNFTLKYSDPTNTTVSYSTVKILICPSEIKPEPDPSSGSLFGVSNYGWCVGDWYVFGGVGATPNRSAFCVDLSRPIAAFLDGVSNTVVASEVKTYQPLVKSCFANGSGGTLPGLNNPNQVPDPLNSPQYIVAAATNSKCKVDVGHVKWSIGGACFDGFTTALPPNTRVLAGTPQQDYDLDSIDENNGGPTYAAITSRSYHPGGVNSLFGDGSVRFVKTTVAGNIWRALGTIAGGEVVSADQY